MSTGDNNHYPPPPQPDQQHYNPIYGQSNGGQQPLLDQDQQDQINFATQLAEHASTYQKVEHEGLDPSTSTQIEQRIEELQQQQSLQQGAYDQQIQDDQHGAIEQIIDLGTPGVKEKGKLVRLRKACDSCSIRKVKCDEAGPPCKACAALDIPCTYERPSRRRGPPNRHAETIKRRKLDDTNGDERASSPVNAAQALAALSTHPPSSAQPSAESIAPADLINLFINDYFAFIHPLHPFPHEPSFRDAWSHREDYNNRPFLALLAAMIAVLAASYPKKALQHLKSKRRQKMYPTQESLVDACFKTCSSARGVRFPDTETLTVHDASTSYLLSVAATLTGRWRSARLHACDSYNIMYTLGLDENATTTFQDLGSQPAVVGAQGSTYEGSPDEVFDLITLQISHRLFWALLTASSSEVQLGKTKPLLPKALLVPEEERPPFPLELEDLCIFPDHIDPQPSDRLPVLLGFNAISRIHQACQPLYGRGQSSAGQDQRPLYQQCLLGVKNVLYNLPEDLLLVPVRSDTNGQLTSDPLAAFNVKLNVRELANVSSGSVQIASDEGPTQRELLKATIFTTGLIARLYIIQQTWTIPKVTNGSMAGAQDSMGDFEAEMLAEGEDIMQATLLVLSSLERANIEASGDSLARKVRFVATKMLDAPEDKRGPLTQQIEHPLRAFLDVIDRIEQHARSEGTDPKFHKPEEDGLWAEFGERQTRLGQQSGGAALFPTY